MKKFVALIFVFVFFFAYSSPLSAMMKDAGNPVNAQQNGATDSGSEDSGSKSYGQYKKLESATQKTERLMERINNPEVGEQVRSMVENQVNVYEQAQTAIGQLEGRPGLLRFILGPDYKNAGEVRSHIVQVRNQIRQLEQLKEKLGEEDASSLDEIIVDLEGKANELEGDLNQNLTGFSLFGWLGKLLSGY